MEFIWFIISNAILLVVFWAVLFFLGWILLFLELVNILIFEGLFGGHVWRSSDHYRFFPWIILNYIVTFSLIFAAIHFELDRDKVKRIFFNVLYFLIPNRNPTHIDEAFSHDKIRKKFRMPSRSNEQEVPETERNLASIQAETERLQRENDERANELAKRAALMDAELALAREKKRKSLLDEGE